MPIMMNETELPNPSASLCSSVLPPEISKEGYRKLVWDTLEHRNFARFPRPVHGRIPNFEGSETAAYSLSDLNVFKNATVVKVCPDKPQEWVRILAVERKKTVLIAVPRLRNGLFQQISSSSFANCKQPVSKQNIKLAASPRGAQSIGRPVGLDINIKVDLVVVGSVAVSEEGHRIGKGEGFAELEYAILRETGAISEDTPVVTSVHDVQVFKTFPKELFEEYDSSIDIIVTPTRIIHCKGHVQKPRGIIWKYITPKKLREIPILRALRNKHLAMGKDCALKSED